MAGVTEFNNSKDNLIMHIRKRDGRTVNFAKSKISDAIYKALVATGKPNYPLAEKLANRVR
jgi:ribonucleoside-diphosphate reductase alpha chain